MRKKVFEAALIIAIIVTLLTSPKNTILANWWFAVFPNVCTETQSFGNGDAVIKFRFVELIEHILNTAGSK